MKLIVITAPEFLPGEAEVLNALLGNGLHRLHVRKPCSTEDELAVLVEQIHDRFRQRVTLHDHFELQQRYSLGGVHLNGRNPSVPEGFLGTVSRSCHSLDEVVTWKEHADYLFLSPIFDSISKSGYRSGFSCEQLCEAADRGIIDSRVFALGGVSTENLPNVRSMGFGGAVFLGDIWSRYHSPADMQAVLCHFEKLRSAAVDDKCIAGHSSLRW